MWNVILFSGVEVNVVSRIQKCRGEGRGGIDDRGIIAILIVISLSEGIVY